jgi:hypothetical protein
MHEQCARKYSEGNVHSITEALQYSTYLPGETSTVLEHICITNQHDALFFTLFFYHAATCFGLFLAHHQKAKRIMWQWNCFYY